MKGSIFLLFSLLAFTTCTQDSYSVPGFTSDFSKTVIDFSEILSGGPQKDGIPAIDNPVFVSAQQAQSWLKLNEPVLIWPEGNKIYPLQILIWHEIVNDDIIVTYCPLCNTGIAFKRNFNGFKLDFGTTGRLRNSNLLMYDRQTETWWQQANGQAVIGRFAGEKLETIPLLRASFEEALNILDEPLVLSRETGFQRSYGINPYVNYEDPRDFPFLFKGTIDRSTEVAPLDKVISIDLSDSNIVIPYSVIREKGFYQFNSGSANIVIFYADNTVSALDDRVITNSYTAGSANPFNGRLAGRSLIFYLEDGVIKISKLIPVGTVSD